LDFVDEHISKAGCGLAGFEQLDSHVRQVGEVDRVHCVLALLEFEVDGLDVSGECLGGRVVFAVANRIFNGFLELPEIIGNLFRPPAKLLNAEFAHSHCQRFDIICFLQTLFKDVECDLDGRRYSGQFLDSLADHFKINASCAGCLLRR